MDRGLTPEQELEAKKLADAMVRQFREYKANTPGELKRERGELIEELRVTTEALEETRQALAAALKQRDQALVELEALKKGNGAAQLQPE